jgi:hypothetical protein
VAAKVHGISFRRDENILKPAVAMEVQQ